MELSIQETVETTKALLRLIQLMSLHPIMAVIFSNCSAQEPHGMDMHTADPAAAPPLAGDCWGYCLLLPRGHAKGCLGGTHVSSGDGHPGMDVSVTPHLMKV